MTTREHAPVGAPCWTDLWTSDVEASRAFYGELFGWEAAAPSADFGGYFMFLRDGVPVAGGMGDMGDQPADNRWKIYLATNDLAKTAAAAEAAGAQLLFPPMAVADMGVQSVMVDPTGAALGCWEPGTFPGFTVLNEPNAPSFFELFTRDFPASLAFYRSVFGWETQTVGDSDEFRYTVAVDPEGGQLAGVMDASAFLPDGVPAHWSIYWEVADIGATVADVERLGGVVVAVAVDTPYGRLATVADPAGAQFKLRQSNQ